jgi:hypothetical protein
MYENRKMRPAETILRMEGGEIKENYEGINLTNMHGKQFCKVTMYPQYDNMIIKKFFKKSKKHVLKEK